MNILNQTDDISGTDGPKSGGKHPLDGRSSFFKGAIETKSLKGCSKFLNIFICTCVENVQNKFLRIVFAQKTSGSSGV